MWATADEVARAGVDGLDEGRRLVVPGVANRAVMLAGQCVPVAIKLAIIQRAMRPR